MYYFLSKKYIDIVKRISISISNNNLTDKDITFCGTFMEQTLYNKERCTLCINTSTLYIYMYQNKPDYYCVTISTVLAQIISVQHLSIIGKMVWLRFRHSQQVLATVICFQKNCSHNFTISSITATQSLKSVK